MDGTDEQKAQIALSPGFVPVCAIGASAGGVTALQALFRHLPTDLGLAYVVILHLAPDQPSALAEILSSCTKMPVHLVEDGPTLKRDSVFVIPPDRELVIDGDSVTARPFSEPRGRRAPVDLFFRSIAAARGDGIAVVLSGAGADGALGVRAVKEAGGVVMVQDPAEAEFSSMPQNAIASGAADFVAPIARLIDRLREVAHSKEAVRSLDMDGAANDLRRIVAFLRARTGHDFSSYKRATVLRRVLRRTQVCRLDTLSGYADHLYANPEEAKELFGDLLISVTSFFRDARAFEALDHHTLKPLFDALEPGSEEGVRGWVVGCATGEEVYSIAILLLEEMHRRKLFVPIQIFATDLDEGALATAREGRYPRTIEADVSDERLGRFFVDEGTHYRVRKDLRELVLFASHSVLKEPPFMRLDLISCRNLLIYMERSLQQQVYAIFHYGLKLGGSLFLGSAETVDSASDLFAAVDREARIYVTRPKAVQMLPILPQYAAPERFPATGQMLVAPLRPEQASLSTALHVASLEQGAPPSALVDDGHNVLHLSPTAGRFIIHSGGPISNVLPAVVRPELRLDLKFALTRVTEQSLPTLTHPAEVTLDGKQRRVALHVVPVQRDERTGRNALVFFLDSGPVDDGERSTAPNDVQPDEVRRLHAELRAAQEALVASRHNHEASIQDLRAANEELQSMNEEYRSTAEELETSKEELQSINEELHTVNAEMKSKLESISAAHSDLQNLTAATEVGTLFLDGQLRIRMFTPPVAGIFNITATDIGRAITDFTHQLDYDAVERDARQLLAELVPVEREVISRDGRWYVMRLRPYRTVEDRIDGTVVTFVDITGRRAAEQALSRSEQQLRSLARASSQVLYRMSPDWSEMRELLGAGVLFNTERPTDGWFESYIPADERARVRAAIQDAIDSRGLFDLEHRVYRADGSIGWVHSRAVGSFDDDGTVSEWFGSANDVTAHRQAEAALRESEERFAQFAASSSDALWVRDAVTLEMEYVSPAIEEIYGVLPDALLDGPGHWTALIVPEDRDTALAHLEQAKAGDAVMHEFRILRPSDGALRWIRNTDFPLRDAGGRVQRIGGIAKDVTELKAIEAALTHSEQRLRTLVEGMPLLVWRAVGDGDWTWASPQWAAYTGQAEPDSHHLGWLNPVHPEDRGRALEAWGSAVENGGFEVEYRIHQASDGLYRWFQTRATPVRNAKGEIVEWLGTTTDVQELKALQAQQGVMVTELQHRTRNLITVVRSIAEDTMEHTGTMEAFRAAFADRLSALSRVQGLLSRSEAEPISIGALVQLELDALGNRALKDRITTGGPEVFLRPSSVQTLALALHELATNARKYGALSHDRGHLAVTWREKVEDGVPRLVLDWLETGLEQNLDRPGLVDSGGGYGRELIEQALPHATGARTTYMLTASDVHCMIDLAVRSGMKGTDHDDS